MPAIWNVNNSYNVNNKKYSSKLTFEVGEKFSGKIISKGEGNEVTVKLADGWQFSATIDGNIESEENVPLQLQVEGYEDGKLKLKIVKKEVESNNLANDSLSEVIDKEGLGKDDIDILKKMVKHNIPLTRENITFVKSLLQFNTKINMDNNEIDNFILKYIDSKGISGESEQGKQIINTLKEFFVNFKNLKPEEILFFLENNIELTSENIESFKKLFSSNGNTLKEFFDNIKNDFAGIEVEMKELEDNISNSKIEEKHLDNSLKALGEEINKDKLGYNSLVSKLYDSNDMSKGKVSMLAVLKSMTGGDDNLLREPIKDILIGKKEQFTTNEYNTALGKINNLSDEEFINIVKDVLGRNGELKEISKDTFNIVLRSLFGKDIEVGEAELRKIQDVIEYKFQELELNNEGVNEDKLIGNNIVNKTITTLEQEVITGGNKKILSANELIKNDINKKINGIKDIIKELLVASKGEGEGAEKVIQLLKNNISEFKLFNTISNEYYYLDVPINREMTEYPCKLIIKDNRKDGKKIDRTDVKIVVTVKTVNLGVVDGFLSVKDKGLDVELKCDKNYTKVLELSKSKLSNDLQKLGFNINIKVSMREEDITLASCREFFNDKAMNGIDIKV
ncbi:flagellar hook-length control protein FliK [Clostridium paraputrificum]|uniref:flagellar hook-length control protein FliK n=1 Tax=Clostridium paraputrificum TaxID=29363 RepID=UPI00232FE06E|nr:flagellar hook-length control protein FliK [Clostridium paraputrificum]MDB2106254.1 flagellar hook-length control protein FliK [Clostridium paraputrificum]MDB2112945.1 flagellar hook-length control protein FliK [Clostridium paraputrificum]